MSSNPSACGRLFQKLRNLLAVIARTILHTLQKEWPFFILFFVLISVNLLKAVAAGSFNQMIILGLLRGLALSFILTLIIFLTKSKALKTLFYTLGIVLFTVTIFLWLVFHMVMSPEIAQFIVETTPSEASQFSGAFILRGSGLVVVAITIAVTLGIIWFEKRGANLLRRFSLGKTLQKVTAGIVTVLVLVGVTQFDLFYKLAITDTSDKFPSGDPCFFDAISNTCMAVTGLNVTRNDILRAIETTQSTKGGTIAEADSVNIVLIIGESYIKSHAALYGYRLPTTPHLMQEQKAGNLFVFDNVIAPSASTSQVVRNVLACNSLADGEQWYNSPYLPTIFKRSGFQVYLWDNQREDCTRAAQTTFTLQAYLYNDKMMASAYTKTNEKSSKYDDGIVTDFEQKKGKMGKANLVIFHLWGQHIGASERYPHTTEYERFGIKDEKRNEPYINDTKRQDIAYYDNATLYNDAVIDHIIRLYRGTNTAIVYFSDHGEEVYDYRDCMGRKAPTEGLMKPWVKNQFEIPFMIWCSDRYIAQHPQVIRDIQESLHKPFTTDNVCQVLFHLSGLNTQYYKPERDLLSPQFKQRDRVVGKDIHYDEIVVGKASR